MDLTEEWSQQLSGGKFLPAPYSMCRHKQQGQTATQQYKYPGRSLQPWHKCAGQGNSRRFMQVSTLKVGIGWFFFCWFFFFSPLFVWHFFSLSKQNTEPFQHKPMNQLNQHFSKALNSVCSLTLSLIWNFEGILNTLHSLGMPSVWPVPSMQYKIDPRRALLQYPASVQTSLPDFPEFRISFCLAFCLYVNTELQCLGNLNQEKLLPCSLPKLREVLNIRN